LYSVDIIQTKQYTNFIKCIAICYVHTNSQLVAYTVLTVLYIFAGLNFKSRVNDRLLNLLHSDTILDKLQWLKRLKRDARDLEH